MSSDQKQTVHKHTHTHRFAATASPLLAALTRCDHRPQSYNHHKEKQRCACLCVRFKTLIVITAVVCEVKQQVRQQGLRPYHTEHPEYLLAYWAL